MWQTVFLHRNLSVDQHLEDNKDIMDCDNEADGRFASNSATDGNDNNHSNDSNEKSSESMDNDDEEFVTVQDSFISMADAYLAEELLVEQSEHWKWGGKLQTRSIILKRSMTIWFFNILMGKSHCMMKKILKEGLLSPSMLFLIRFGMCLKGK